MKVKRRKEEKKRFKPLTLEITFETMEEIKYLHARLKDGTLKFVELSRVLGDYI